MVRSDTELNSRAPGAAEGGIVKVREVSVFLGGTARIDRVSFSLAAGEVAAIIGPNGAGKSTLLRAVAGDVALAAGSIEVCGRDHRHWNLRERARHLAVLPQGSGLNFPYRVEEVVALSRIPHATGRRIDGEVVAEALAAADLTHLRRRRYTELSGGERQRTQLARVLAQIWRAADARDRLLLLDEPTAALDLGHQQQLMQQVRAFAAGGAAVLLVLHDLNLAAGVADRLLALGDGRLLAEGSAAEVMQRELLQRLFGVRLELLLHPQTGRPLVVL